MYSKILVPTDGTKRSDRAIKHAAQLASMAGAQVLLLHVYQPYDEPFAAELAPSAFVPRPTKSAIKAHARVLLDRAEKLVTDRDVVVRASFVISPSPYEEILKTVKKEGCDLIVMASHGRRGLSAVLMGSVAQKVLTHTKCPVLIVR